MMRIVVLGSTSRTGLCLLAEAHRRGHQIVAFTRRPQALPRDAPPALVVHGDGRDPAALRTALSGADAAISLLPGGGQRDPHLAADTTRGLINAMTNAGVKRLVVVSAYPIVADRPRPLVWLLRRLLATPYADTADMERLVSASDLNWTITRLNRLTDGPATGAITTSHELLNKARPHSRADIAKLLLDLATDLTQPSAAINVSGT